MLLPIVYEGAFFIMMNKFCQRAVNADGNVDPNLAGLMVIMANNYPSGVG